MFAGGSTTRRAARQRADVTPTPPAPRPAPELPQSCRGAPGGSGERQPEGRRRALAHSSPAIPADLKAVFQAIGPVWGREVPVLCLLALPGVTSNLSAGGSGLLAFLVFPRQLNSWGFPACCPHLPKPHLPDHACSPSRALHGERWHR